MPNTTFGELSFSRHFGVKGQEAGLELLYAPGPSCEISAITLAPRDLFYALLRARYLALLGLRIRSRKRTCVDAAIHQLGELPRLPGAVEVGVRGGVLARRELHLAFCGGHGVLDVHLELR